MPIAQGVIVVCYPYIAILPSTVLRMCVGVVRRRARGRSALPPGANRADMASHAFGTSPDMAGRARCDRRRSVLNGVR